LTRQPKISVIMPTLNQGRYIGEAIRSVAEQEYANLELIVIDGGSSDETLQEIKRLSVHIHYWISEKDRGQSHAINKGLAQASGEIVTWLNSDDRYTKGALAKAARMFTDHAGAAFVHGRAELFGEGRVTRTVGPTAQLLPHQYLPYMRFPQPSSFFDRSALQAALPVNEELHYCMDFELVARCILLKGQGFSTMEVLSGYRLHEAAKTSQEERFMSEWSHVLLNVFGSIEGGATYADKMKELGLDQRKAISVYPCTRVFSALELKEIFLEHLDLYFHYHYRNMDRPACERLYNTIMREDPDFARRKKYRTYLFRLRYLPGILRLRRRLAP
jgi:glycosyltransferase involved in cell wall biosynthesis